MPLTTRGTKRSASSSSNDDDEETSAVRSNAADRRRLHNRESSISDNEMVDDDGETRQKHLHETKKRTDEHLSRIESYLSSSSSSTSPTSTKVSSKTDDEECIDEKVQEAAPMEQSTDDVVDNNEKQLIDPISIEAAVADIEHTMEEDNDDSTSAKIDSVDNNPDDVTVEATAVDNNADEVKWSETMYAGDSYVPTIFDHCYVKDQRGKCCIVLYTERDELS